MRRPVRRPARRPMAGIGSLGPKAKPGTKKPSSAAVGKIKPAVKKAVRPGMTKKRPPIRGPKPTDTGGRVVTPKKRPPIRGPKPTDTGGRVVTPKKRPAVKKAVRPGMTKKPSRPTGPRPIRPPRRGGRRR